MSRSGYGDYDSNDHWGHIRWRGAVARGFKGKRGQEFLKEAIEVMDGMEVKSISNLELGDPALGYCTLGVVGAAREMDLKSLQFAEAQTVGDAFGISGAMAAEIMFMNDEAMHYDETGEERWKRMRRFLEHQLNDEKLNAP